MAVVLTIVLFIVIFFVITAVYQKLKHRECVCGRGLEGRTALVTGGTAGMGLEIAAELARRGARVIVACPFPEEGRAALRHIARTAPAPAGRVLYKHLELGSLASTRALAADILQHEHRLDILVNNAAVGGPATRTTQDGINFVMQVNYFGTFLLTLLLLPLLKKTGKPGEPSRIVNVASILNLLGVIDINHLNAEKPYRFFKWEIYANSKLCLVMFTRELAKRLKGENVVVNSLEPGVVGTGIYETWDSVIGLLIKWFCRYVCKSPRQGAQTALHVALDEAAGAVSGEHFAECAVYSTIRRTPSDKLSSQLWEESLKLVKWNSDQSEE